VAPLAEHDCAQCVAHILPLHDALLTTYEFLSWAWT